MAAAIAQRRWRQQTPAQSSTSTAPQHPKCFIYTMGPAGREAIGRGSEHPCLHIIHCSSAQPASRGFIIVSCWAHALCRLFGATLLERRRVVQPAGSHDRARPSFTPSTTTTTTTCIITTAASRTPYPILLPFTSLPASPLLLSAEHRPTTARCRLSASRATRTLRPPACTLHLATLVPLTLTRPPSRCTTRCDAWLTRVVADSSSLPTDLLARFNDTLLPPLLRFRALRIPSSPSPDSGFARLHVHKRLLVLHFASLHLATATPSRAPLIDLVTATRSSFEHP